MSEPATSPYAEVESALRDEFAGIHSASTVTRCVEAAHYGALEVTGYAHPGPGREDRSQAPSCPRAGGQRTRLVKIEIP
ncbi:hypothetical protein [Nonomuraea dietziae]|uniref:hypothetical protein n=1 Tax=Nonomuraea dietziae TaxID=65515 RepID=UPI003CD0576E